MAEEAPVPSGSPCPSCGTITDPLRAGQVAILDGAFRYFCNSQCKADFIEATSKRSALEARTAEPPQVLRVEVVESGVRTTPPAPLASGTVSFPPVDGAAEVVATPERDEEEVSLPSPAFENEAAPSTLRSPAEPPPVSVATVEETAQPTRPQVSRVSHDWEGIAHGAAIGAGVIAAVVSLAGEAANVLRLPLALLAAGMAVFRATRRPREATEVSPWVAASPVLVAALAATGATLVRAAGADTLASFVGLAGAAVLLVEILTTRARRDVMAARANIAVALAGRARVLRGAETMEVDAGDVKPGEQVVVHAGETVLVDGVIVAGGGEMAPWLDAPVVTDKREGDAIVAGATLLTGRLRVTATFSGSERAWLRLARPGDRRLAAPLVALGKRGLERGAPLAALVVAGLAYANRGSWTDIVMAACAGGHVLAAIGGISAATLAHARGQVSAQRRGIVYRDPESFDAAGRVDVAVVCSRGTILLGEPELVAVEATKQGTAEGVERVLALAAGAEMASSHPFAAAVLRAARAREVRPENVRSALKHSGLGVTALAPSGDKLIVGSRAFLLKERVSVAIADARASELEAQGRSVLLVALGGRLVGLLALQDGLRAGARAAIQRLHDARIEPVLLSGEARDTCETIARALEIEHVRPEILPADRAAEVRALADGGHVIAAIGHASSDDGALGAADVPVAMSAAGSAPGESAVALASDDVRDAALALTVPRASREKAKTAALVGLVAQALASLGIGFALAPAAAAPVLGVLATTLALALVRDPR